MLAVGEVQLANSLYKGCCVPEDSVLCLMRKQHMNDLSSSGIVDVFPVTFFCIFLEFGGTICILILVCSPFFCIDFEASF